MEKYKCSNCGPLANCICTVSYVEYVRIIELLAVVRDYVDDWDNPSLRPTIDRTIDEADLTINDSKGNAS